MLSSISLKNFKGFQELNGLDVKPVTILCGVNSCGKSSILQSLLMFKQTKESRNPNNILLLNGGLAHLGSVENIIYGKDLDKKCSFSFSFSFDKRSFFNPSHKRRTPNMRFYYRYIISKNFRDITDEHRVELSFGFKASDASKGYIKTADITSFEVSVYSRMPSGEEVKGSSVQIKKYGNGYDISWSKIESPHDPSEAPSSGTSGGHNVNFENMFPRFPQKIRREEGRDIPYQVDTFLRCIDEVVRMSVEGLTYVGPLREEPARRYIYDNEVLEIGSKGENAAYIFQTEFDNNLGEYFVFSDRDEKFVKTSGETLAQGLERWMKLMGIKGFRPEFHREIIQLNMEANSNCDTSVNIADVGFGVSQIFPILLEGLRMPKNGTLLLEQPEIHLHPNLQMQMADYFISMALSNKNVVVETHSDHVINRLVRRILEDRDHSLSEKVAIYFVSNGSDGSYIDEVKIDPNMGIVNWPEGFFDQTATEQEKIMMAGIKKRKEARESK